MRQSNQQHNTLTTHKQTQGTNGLRTLGSLTMMKGINGIKMKLTALAKATAITLLTAGVTLTASATEISYYHTDHLGTPKAMTDSSGNIVWQATHDAFGKATVTTETVANNLRFPGQYFDQETNLHYNYFRTYDPNIGRYITSDPIGLGGGLNTYAYALDNPVRYTDPTGQAVPLAIYSCIASPQCAVLVISTCYYVIKAVQDTAKIIYKDECDGDICDGAGDEHPPERKDLNDLIKDLTNDGRKPLSADDADAAIDLADEIGVPGVRDDRNVDHWKGGPHIHIPQTGVGDGRHIPASPHK